MPMLTTVRIRSPVTPVQAPRADLVGERVDPAQHLVHVGHDVLAVDLEGGVRRQPQRGVQHGAVLGDVDVLAAEHRVAALGDADLVGQREQRGQHVVVEQRLRQVDVQVARGEGQPLDPARVVGEPAAQVGLEAAARAVSRAHAAVEVGSTGASVTRRPPPSGP